MFEREFDFFDKVTSISGVLLPLPKEERRAGIRRYYFTFMELFPLLQAHVFFYQLVLFFYFYFFQIFSCYRELEKIEVEGDDLYLPTAPGKLVRSIQLDSGIPLQSAAKVPIMITFNVVDRDGTLKDVKPQACIFKVN